LSTEYRWWASRVKWRTGAKSQGLASFLFKKGDLVVHNLACCVYCIINWS